MTPPARPNRALLFFTVFLDVAGFGMILPLLPFYAQRYGADPVRVGALFACYSLAQALCAPILGRLSDRYGRRPVLLLALLANAAALALFGFARTFVVLFIARTASGMAAANFSIAQAYVADTTPPRERTKRLGMIGAAVGMGFVLGPGIGGALSLLGQRAVPFGSALLALVNVLLVFFLLPESLPPERRSRLDGIAFVPFAGLARADRAVLGLLGLFFLVLFAFSTMEGTLALYCQHRFGFGVGQTSVFMVGIGVVIAAVQGGLVGRLAARFGERRLMLAGIVIMAVGLAVLPTAPMVGALAGAGALLAIGSGIHQPSLLGLVSRLTDEATQGETLGLSRSMQALARTLGPLWGGWTFQTLGPPWPFWTAAMVMAVAGGFALLLLLKSAGEPVGQPA
jgi:DHA1 family tetracycline resistance protein-like MFS transporter